MLQQFENIRLCGKKKTISVVSPSLVDVRWHCCLNVSVYHSASFGNLRLNRGVFTPLPKHNHILEKGFFVALWWWCWSCSRTAPAALWSAPAKTDSARGGRCGHFWECTSAPRSAPAARGVWDCWGAGGHFLVPQGNIYRKRAKNICFRLLIGRSGAGATGNPERKNKNLMTLSSRLMFGLYLRKCCNIV